MKIVHIVNLADAQSIPLELALAIRHRLPQTVVAGFYAQGDHPADHPDDAVVSLGARKAWDLRAVRRLARLIRVEQPDIIHVHHSVSALWATLIGLARFRRPLLIKTEHNDHRFLPWHQHVINALIYPVLSRIICNSDSTQASFTPLERWLAGGRSLRIYNGVDLRKVRTNVTPAQTPGDSIVIGNIGRLVAQKNQARLIAGLAIARARTGRDIRLEIIGHGPLRQNLEQAARAAGVAASVHFSGALPRKSVYARLSGWQGFVMASTFEGFGNALVEAMAIGLPVAVSDIDTLREVADTGAMRFDPTNPEAIGQAISELAMQPHSSGQFANRYGIEHAVEHHISLYKSLLHARRLPSGVGRHNNSVAREQTDPTGDI
ncbi:MAG: glycosyltransferase [Pseudomonadota bacterium]